MWVWRLNSVSRMGKITGRETGTKRCRQAIWWISWNRNHRQIRRRCGGMRWEPIHPIPLLDLLWDGLFVEFVFFLKILLLFCNTTPCLWSVHQNLWILSFAISEFSWIHPIWRRIEHKMAEWLFLSTISFHLQIRAIVLGNFPEGLIIAFEIPAEVDEIRSFLFSSS